MRASRRRRPVVSRASERRCHQCRLTSAPSARRTVASPNSAQPAQKLACCLQHFFLSRGTRERCGDWRAPCHGRLSSQRADCSSSSCSHGAGSLAATGAQHGSDRYRSAVPGIGRGASFRLSCKTLPASDRLTRTQASTTGRVYRRAGETSVFSTGVLPRRRRASKASRTQMPDAGARPGPRWR